MGSEWREVKLEDVARELTVGYVGSMTSEYVKSGIPFLRSKNVDTLNINTGDLKYISGNFHKKIGKSRLTPGDVVIVRTGKPGTCAVIPHWLEEANCSDLVIVRCGPEINNHFLSYYVNTVALSHVNAHLVGAVQQHFNVGSAKTMKVYLPPINEQEGIVEVLGTLDGKIELNRQMNATLEAMAQALFKSWFVDFDPVIDNALAASNPIPDALQAKAERRKALGDQRKPLPAAIEQHFPDRFVFSEEVGWIPEGWGTQALYDIANFVNGAAFKSEHFSDDPEALPVVKIAEIKNGLTGQAKYTKREMDEKYLIDNGEILLSWSGNPDTSIDTFIWTKGLGLLNQHIFRVILKDESERYFVYYQLKVLRSTFAEIARDKQTTGLGHFTLSDMKRMHVLLLSKALIRHFNIQVSAIFERWYGNLINSQSLSRLRDTLLPKLLSGQLRIPEAEKLVTEAT